MSKIDPKKWRVQGFNKDYDTRYFFFPTKRDAMRFMRECKELSNLLLFNTNSSQLLPVHRVKNYSYAPSKQLTKAVA